MRCKKRKRNRSISQDQTLTIMSDPNYAWFSIGTVHGAKQSQAGHYTHYSIYMNTATTPGQGSFQLLYKTKLEYNISPTQPLKQNG